MSGAKAGPAIEAKGAGAGGGAAGHGPASGHESSGAHVLLFEDDDTLASLLARVLRADGCQVDVLESANATPGPAKLARYDVVISDIHLAEETNGHEVLRRVRTVSPTTPVI